jgi:hypothetical protein
LDHFDKLAVNSSGEFRQAQPDISFPTDIHQPCLKRASPRHYVQAVYCQLIQVIRAIQLRESLAVNGDIGRQCVALMESALAMVQPLDTPWLNVKRQAAIRKYHWSAGR